MLTIGEILRGRYRIIKQLGRGGMGAVYEAHDNVFDTTIALKEILIDLTKITTAKQQQMISHAFEREAKILAMVKHEAFPHVRDYFIEVDRQYLVMELVDGEDLGGLLDRRQSAFPLANVLHWSTQLLDALDYLHTLTPPIIHRDIKPQNLKLTSRGKIKLLDFGIAKGKDSGAEATITNQTFVAATLNYSPLEQILRVLDPTFQEVISQRYDEKSEKILKQAADARSDLYALGATIYHLVTNKLPIDALKRAMEIWQGKPDPLTAPSELSAEISDELSGWILKSMELEHEYRFASAVEMHSALQSALEGEKVRDDETKQAQLTAQQQKLDEERKSVEAQRREMEEEKRRREENDQKRLADAQTQRQIADQSAPDAEKRVTDSGRELSPTVAFGVQNPDALPPSSPFSQPPQETIQSNSAQQFEQRSFTGETPTVVGQNQYSSDPFISAPTEPPRKSSKLLWLIPVVLLLFLMVGGGIAAWLIFKPTEVASNMPINNAPIVGSNTNVNANANTSKRTAPDGMVLIEGASFTMGAEEGDVAEMPAHEVTVKSFYMDKYEVTREEYAKCVDAGTCNAPANWKNGKYENGTGKLPVVGVSFIQARDYAAWAKKRLPTEEEWEFAARGTDKRAFPWGGSWEDGKANANGESQGFSEVGKYSGASPFGLYDMVGNAWEWTSSAFKAYPKGELPPNAPKGDARVIRGGSYESNAKYATTTYRTGWLAQGAPTYDQTSFRCAKDIER